MAGPLIELWQSRAILYKMTVRDFRARYAGSLMGLFWTVITPLLLLLVFTFIFTVVFKAKFGDRAGVGISAIYIFSGILPWLAFQEGLSRSATSPLENKNLVTRVRFPASALPAFPTLSAMLGQAGGFALLVIIAAAWVQTPGPPLALLPLVLILQALFTLGLALMVSALAVYFRDVVHVLPVLLLVWFYGTPVFYPASLVPEPYGILISLNPMSSYIRAIRAVVLEASWPDPLTCAACVGFAAVSLAAGSFIFGRLRDGFSDQL